LIWNIGVSVHIDYILTTHMNVPGVEPTYASGKEMHLLMYYTGNPIYVETGQLEICLPVPAHCFLSNVHSVAWWLLMYR
jgi:hypothetical protein